MLVYSCLHVTPRLNDSVAQGKMYWFQSLTYSLVQLISALVRIYRYVFMYIKHAVAQLVEALRFKPEGRDFRSRWCHWNISLRSFRPHSGPGVTQLLTGMSTRNISWGVKSAGA
jgi:hypothetical protein